MFFFFQTVFFTRAEHIRELLKVSKSTLKQSRSPHTSDSEEHTVQQQSDTSHTLAVLICNEMQWNTVEGQERGNEGGGGGDDGDYRRQSKWSTGRWKYSKQTKEGKNIDTVR